MARWYSLLDCWSYYPNVGKVVHPAGVMGPPCLVGRTTQAWSISPDMSRLQQVVVLFFDKINLLSNRNNFVYQLRQLACILAKYRVDLLLRQGGSYNLVSRVIYTLKQFALCSCVCLFKIYLKGLN